MDRNEMFEGLQMKNIENLNITERNPHLYCQQFEIIFLEAPLTTSAIKSKCGC